jgi:hypothetical protein
VSKYGSYAILEDVIHTFEKEPGWTWTIKPVTMSADTAMAQFMSAERTIMLADGTRIFRPVTTQEIALREIALTFRSTTIKGDDGEPVLKDSASIAEVEALLGEMPVALVNEIWQAVGKACPPWGPVMQDQAKAKKSK